MLDAFVKFDFSKNGRLSLGEVFGALEWLGIPDVTPHDILDFVRGITRGVGLVRRVRRGARQRRRGRGRRRREPAAGSAAAATAAPRPRRLLPVRAAALAAAAADDDDPGRRPAAVARAAGVARRAARRVGLEALLASRVQAEREEEARLEAEQKEHADAARRRSTPRWPSRTSRGSPRRAARRARIRARCARRPTSTSRAGSRPRRAGWAEPRGGEARHVRSGGVPCWRLGPKTGLIARVPFQKNGGGSALNCYSITLFARFAEEPPDKGFSLVSNVGFDSFLPKAEGDTDAQAMLAENGAIAPVIGEEGSGPQALAADTEGPTVCAREWHSLAFVVDTNAGSARTYVDGALSVEARSTRSRGTAVRD